jgi:membrane protein DedA with SNARE-associated domain
VLACQPSRARDTSVNDLLQSLLTQHAFTTVFVVLILCGAGLPLPEEVPLIGGGWAVHKMGVGLVAYWPMAIVACTAILIGDSLMFGLGSWFGLDVLRMRFLRRIFPPRRIRQARKAFDRHGWKAVFFARFLPGFRLAAYFLAGTLGMRWSFFVLLDLMGCLITVPISIWLGWHFGPNIDRAFEVLEQFRHVLIVVVVAAGLVWLLLWLWRRRREGRVTVDEVIDEVKATVGDGGSQGSSSGESRR